MNIEEAYNAIKKSVEAINTRPYATKAEYEKVECIKVLLTAYEKEKEKNKELQEEITERETRLQEEINENCMLKTELYGNSIPQDKIEDILGIEDVVDEEKILSLLQTIVDENNRLEDIEDRKVQVDYERVFNKGVKSVEDKIKAKIEEIEKLKTDDENSIINKIVDWFINQIQSLLEKE